MEKIRVNIEHGNGSWVLMESDDEKSAQEMIKALKKFVKTISKKK